MKRILNGTERTGNIFLGESLNSIYTLECGGIATEANRDQWEGIDYNGKNVGIGDLFAIDQNGDKIVDQNDRVIVGCMDPKMYGGFSTDFSWKGVTLNAIFNYSIGGKKISEYYESLLASTGTSMASTDLLDRWSTQNPNGSFPRAITNTSSGYNPYYAWDTDFALQESIRYDFSYYGETPNLDCVAWEDLGEDHDELKPHVKKYEDFRTDQHSGLGLNNMWNSGKNIPMLRYADVILSYAECLNELNRTSDAVDVVNQVRNRAWGFNLPDDLKWGSMTADEFRVKIMDERMRELCGENWRRFDLIRTGKFVEYVKERNKWAKRSGTIDAHNMRYPIPNEEIEQNEDMTTEDQNEGYR